ncbi:MAG: NitT/TauT family transport system substrate-binding protein [Candidatus Eremiobacteraeota bacterium]|jgi:NitT/TauT family transport system substrate-binding protein|nr:NitT/TauT family transport system substrate-binding protein [Candidatus Eremiobacteraeota bacterium]
MTSRARFLATAAAGAAASAFPTAIFAQGRKALTIGYVPSTLFAPVFVAVEKGYLRDAGFDTSLTPIVAGADSMSLVAQGQIDVAAAALSAAFYNAVNRGLEVKFVAATGYQPRHGRPSALLIRQDLYDGGLRVSPALKGRKFGWIGNTGAASAYYVARILRTVGLRLTDIEALNIPNPEQQTALEHKAIDVLFTSAPFSDEFAQKRLGTIVASPPPGIAASGVFFGPALLHNHDNASAVMTALRKAAAEIVGNGFYDPANLAAYAKYTKQPVDVIKSAPRYDFKPDLRIDQGTLEDMQREFVADKILTYKEPLNEVRLVARF